jgi:large subunit ribosomal protein L21
MYAVIETGGKQYRVAPGDVIEVEKLDANEGQEVALDRVLMVADGDNVKIGAPMLSGAKVTVKVKGHGRADKVRIFKLRRRKNYRRTQGHRQHFTKIEILGISG